MILTIHKTDETGDTVFEVDTEVQEQVDLGTEFFKEALSEGGWAFAECRERNVFITTLDEAIAKEATRVILAPRYVGG